MKRRGSRKGKGKNKGNHLDKENLLLSAFLVNDIFAAFKKIIRFSLLMIN